MASNKNRIQFLLNEYLERHGSIDLLLPDGMGVEIGITEESKTGYRKCSDYCWVMATRDNRSAILDKYVMSMQFDDDNRVVEDVDQRIVTII